MILRIGPDRKRPFDLEEYESQSSTSDRVSKRHKPESVEEPEEGEYSDNILEEGPSTSQLDGSRSSRRRVESSELLNDDIDSFKKSTPASSRAKHPRASTSRSSMSKRKRLVPVVDEHDVEAAHESVSEEDEQADHSRVSGPVESSSFYSSSSNRPSPFAAFMRVFGGAKGKGTPLREGGEAGAEASPSGSPKVDLPVEDDGLASRESSVPISKGKAGIKTRHGATQTANKGPAPRPAPRPLSLAKQQQLANARAKKKNAKPSTIAAAIATSAAAAAAGKSASPAQSKTKTKSSAKPTATVVIDEPPGTGATTPVLSTKRLRHSAPQSRNIRKSRKADDESTTRRVKSNRDAIRGALGEPQDFYDVDVEVRVHDDPHVSLKVWHLETLSKHTELQPHTISHTSWDSGKTVSSFRYASDTRGVIIVEVLSLSHQAKARHSYRSQGDRVLLEIRDMKGEWSSLT